ncbi:hypothetical protein MFIFM68171_01768 [Madurella fahalii]|uniref:Uncharacterized protein n=1 Tax=Madurella fahalii TaxID=1157608 RepID=A0ABQ0G1B8_9PEZI
MVSFFGLKFGDKKKKPDGKPAQEKELLQQKRIDQNALGEGQFFGKGVHQTGVVNGSIRSVSRAGTPQPCAGRSLYALHDTHNLAAASMFDLSVGHGRTGSQASLQVKPHASDLNLRTRFGAVNGSSASLAAPGPGFGSRPGTPNKAKPWVNPLDVHFMRPTPSGPPTPKSALAQSAMQLPPTPTTENAETGSVFGEEADDMVDAVMTSVKQQEREAKEAKERERELEKQRETARLEMERLERQKSTESILAKMTPLQPPLEPQPKPTNGPSLEGPVFRGNVEQRPGSRNGLRGPNGANGLNWPARSALHQGPPPTGPPTQCLPQPPGHGPPSQGPLGPSVDTHNLRGPQLGNPGTIEFGPGPGPAIRSNCPPPQTYRPYRPPGSSAPQSPSNGPSPQGYSPYSAGPRDPGNRDPGNRDPGSHGPPNTVRPPGPAVLPPSGPRGPGSDAARSQSPAPKAFGIGADRTQSPGPRGPPPSGSRATGFNPQPQVFAGNGRGTPVPERSRTEPLLSTLTSPAGSISRSSLDEETIELFSRPIIQDVAAKRDALTMNTPRQHSLSMKIEELEKSLINQQHAHQAQKAQVQDANRASASSSIYSDGIKDDDEDDDGPILSIQPAPLYVPPPLAPAASAPRPQSPFRAPLRRGPGPRRPGLEEYGISTTHLASKPRGGTPVPGSAGGVTDISSSHSSPPSRVNTPQLRHPNWKRDLSQPSPASTLDAADRSRPSPVVDTGFNFDFGSGIAAPPTPDSTSWPLSSPTAETGPVLSPTSEPSQTHSPTQASGKFTRSNVPPPLNLKFDFSPDAASRDPTSDLWTPPLRSAPIGQSMLDGRPSTSAGPGGSGLAASPRLISQFPGLVPRDDDPSAFMGIGMARGPSIREVRRPGTANGRGMVDSFGNGFI